MPKTYMGRLPAEVMREKTALTTRTLIELSAKMAGYRRQQDAARALGMPMSTYKRRLKVGDWTLQELKTIYRTFCIDPEIITKLITEKI